MTTQEVCQQKLIALKNTIESIARKRGRPRQIHFEVDDLKQIGALVLLEMMLKYKIDPFTKEFDRIFITSYHNALSRRFRTERSRINDFSRRTTDPDMVSSSLPSQEHAYFEKEADHGVRKFLSDLFDYLSRNANKAAVVRERTVRVAACLVSDLDSPRSVPQLGEEADCSKMQVKVSLKAIRKAATKLLPAHGF